MKKRNLLAGLTALAIAGAVALTPEMVNAKEAFRGGGCGIYGEEKGKPFRHLDRMQYYLGLSDQQVEKIFRIDQEYREKYFKNRNSYESIEKLRLEHRKAIEEVLTDKQKERFNEMRDFRKNNFRGRYPGVCPRGW